MSPKEAEAPDLVKRAIRRDAEAFGQLYDLYLDRIYRYIYYRVGDQAQAEDLTEEVFLKAWEAIGKYRWQGIPFGAWLFRLAHNRVIDHFRAQRPRAPLDEGLPAAVDVEEVVESRAAAAQVREALRLLTEEQQQVLILKLIEGLDNREIAAITGKNEGAIRALQFRGLRALRALLTRERG